MSIMPIHSARSGWRIQLASALSSLKDAFGRNRTALAGLVILVVIVAAALAAPLLTHIDPTEQNVLARFQGRACCIISVPTSSAAISSHDCSMAHA